MIYFGKDICTDLAQAISREWLETNGIGGFASSTLCGSNRRRYHALLTAATKPPVGRMVLLSKLEETLIVGEQRVELSTNEYSGAVHPRGYEHIKSFRLDPFPIWTFEADGIEIEKVVFMAYGSNATVARYRLLSAPPGTNVKLELKPLVAFRDYHSLTHANDAIRKDYLENGNEVVIQAYEGVPALHLAHNASSVTATGDWYFNFEYETERERGLDFQEDLFNPLSLTFSLQRSEAATVIASTESFDAPTADDLRKSEVKRRAQIAEASPSDDPFAITLTAASEQYLTKRGDGWTVMAGFPWFTDWGRDTMIALPGLTIYTGREECARSVLLTFAKFVDRGMLPNRFPDQGEQPEFNTVDATLWYFEAIRRYVEATRDIELARELYPVLKDIIEWHIKGTRYGIKLLDNGLLNAGEPGVQLTWMDAKVGDWVVTPRRGQPVEIQALWYNALRIMEDMASQFGEVENQRKYGATSSLLHDTFGRVFWNEIEQCLYDVVDEESDGSIRPNQIFAISLHHPLITGEKAKSILNVVERELLTPFGLRTLSHKDPRYRGRFEGDMVGRDSAYHQGTVWPWLLGPFISAYTKTYGSDEAVRAKIADWLEPLRNHLYEGCLGQIGEVFDGDAPHRPGGCFAQAWSVAEILRAFCADVEGIGLGKKRI